MSDIPPSGSSFGSSSFGYSPKTDDWRELRRQERERRRAERGWSSPSGFFAVLLIGLGVLFLLHNFGVPLPDHWWALFILIPAVAAFSAAARAYQYSGSLNPHVTGPFIGGAVMTLIALIFLLNLPWGIVWPLFLIVAGLAALISSSLRRY
jgi:hypothetical protein